jgi:predicted enzyme related to lactoylglutathione lyase
VEERAGRRSRRKLDRRTRVEVLRLAARGERHPQPKVSRLTQVRCVAVPERPSVAFLMGGEDVPCLRLCVTGSKIGNGMSSRLVALSFDANDPLRLALFWAGVLGWEMADDSYDGIALVPSDDTGFRIRFLATQEQKAGQNRMHFDLTSTSLENQQQTVARSLGLGARHIDVGQRPEEGHVVLADPEGNEFCVIEPGNNFLADCGFIGALACDGSQEVGYFWRDALGWPLVWDQDQETAIRSPHGGPKITWGGPPLMPKTGKNRLHFDLAPPVPGDQQAEVDRLVSLGATRIDIGQGEVSWVVMADPDGNEFCMLPSR